MKINHLLFSVVLPCVAFSQKTTLISGHVFGKKNQALENVIVSILKADSTLIGGTLTDSTGFYKIMFTSDEAKWIKAEMLGFTGEVKALSAATKVDFILLENSNINLEEISIVAKNPIIEYKADKTVFHVENSIAATGGDALDAIKRAPGVQVAHKDITIAGKSSVAVMINGRLQQLSGDDLNQLLHSIPAANISKIEVITSPSSRHDAEGNGGILNLILKKNTQQGLNGSVVLTNDYNSALNFPTAGTSLNYKKDKLNLFCNANGGVQGYKYDAYTNVYYPHQFWHQEVSYPYINKYGRIQAGGDYALTKRSTLGFTANEAFSWLNNNESIVASGFDRSGHLDSTVSTQGKTTDKYPGKLTLNLNYEYRFDSTGKKMNVDLDYYRQKGDKSRDFTVQQESLINSFATQSINRMTGYPLTEIRSAKIDFDIPLKQVRWNCGIKASDSRNELNNLYETKVAADYLVDTVKSTQFSYHEQIEAAYITAGRSWKQFEFSAGLRAEHTRGEGVSNTLSQTKIYDYTKLFPSGFAQYSLNKDHIFSVSVSRRISRPNYSFLNPFRFYYTPSTFAQGNTGLQPAFNYISALNYTYRSKLNVRMMYNTISNYFDRVYTIDTVHQTSAVSRNNLGSKKIIAANISGSAEPAEWWELSGSVNGGFVKFKPFDRSAKSQFTGFNWWVEMTNLFYLNRQKTVSAELSAYYYSGRQRDVVYWAPMSAVNLGLRYLMLHKKLVLTLYAEDIFVKSYWLQTNKFNNTVDYSYDGHIYRISLTYKFGNKNVRAKQVKNLEEIQRAN